jgi:phosphoglycerate dehydrogenase-like enzyme
LRLTTSSYPTTTHSVPDRASAKRLDADTLQRIGRDCVALVVAAGAPLVDDAAMAALPALRLVADIDGDRFADRVDVEAAWARGIVTLDTTNGTSYPVRDEVG